MKYQAYQSGRRIGTFSEADFKRFAALPAYRGVKWVQDTETKKGAEKLPKGVEPAQKGQLTNQDNAGDSEPSPANRASTGGASRKAEK